MRINLLFLSSSLLSLGAQNASIIKDDTYRYINQIDVVQISAIELNRVSTVDIAASFSSNNLKQKHTFTLSRLNPKTNVYDVIESKTLQGKRVSATFNYIETMSASAFLVSGAPGPTLKITYQTTLTTLSPTYQAYFGRESRYSKRIYTKDLTSNKLVTASNAHYIHYDKNIDRTFGEVYEISDFVLNKFYEFNNQNYLDPSFPLFKYLGSSDVYKTDFSYSEAFIYLEDKHNAFPNLRNEIGFVQVAGKLVLDDEFYKFIIDDELYIDPLTRITYKTQKEGYLKTNKLFFPFDVASKFNETENKFALFIYGAGYNRETFIVHINLGLLSTRLIGDCANSSYCVTSSSSEADFTLGTTEEIDA